MPDEFAHELIDRAAGGFERVARRLVLGGFAAEEGGYVLLLLAADDEPAREERAEREEEQPFVVPPAEGELLHADALHAGRGRASPRGCP